MQSEPSGELGTALSEETIRLRQELDLATQERDRLKESLELALASARTAKQELQDFIYAASHDLKEPLRSISSYTQLLQRHGSDPEQLAEYSRFIIEGVATATKLIEQLLRLSRAGANPKRHQVNLAMPLQAALFRLQQVVKELQAEVKVETLPEFSVDESQFSQMFEHLVDNALKYHGPEPLQLTISGGETDTGVLLTIRDNGCGISPEFHKQVFAPFKRLHGREIPGAGLGLPICRRIVEAHEGTIWIEGDEGVGTTVHIALPY